MNELSDDERDLLRYYAETERMIHAVQCRFLDREVLVGSAHARVADNGHGRPLVSR
jgi:hypothetical protein